MIDTERLSNMDTSEDESFVLQKSSQCVLGPVYTATVPNGTVPKSVRIGLAFTRELMESFHAELLSVPKRAHLESRSRLELLERFSSGTLRYQERENSTQGNLKRAILYYDVSTAMLIFCTGFQDIM